MLTRLEEIILLHDVIEELDGRLDEPFDCESDRAHIVEQLQRSCRRLIELAQAQAEDAGREAR